MPDNDKYPKQAGVNHLKEFLDAWKDSTAGASGLPAQPETTTNKPVDSCPSEILENE